MNKTTCCIFILLLNGCSVLDSQNIAPGYNQAYKAIKNAIVGYENEFITSELVQQIPYASSLIRIGRGPYGLMILESKDQTRGTWVSADGAYFVINKGKIIQTKGLLNNVSYLLTPHSFNKLDLLNIPENEVYKYYYSFDFPQLSNLEVTAKYSIKEKKKIKLLNQEKELTLIHEELKNNYIGWNVLNKYWVDEDSFVWKSEQHISPKLPAIMYEVTKKPSN